MDEPLLIRADASPSMGTGHVMRCLSLAGGWQQAGRNVQFLFASSTPALEQRLRDEGMPFTTIAASPGSETDASQTVALARQCSATWVVADGYHFGATYQRQIKAAGLRLLLVDDYGHTNHYSADLMLNQNLSAREEWYKNREPYTRLLLGTRYVLLRKQFLAYRKWPRAIAPVAGKVLVTLGGADPDNVTGKVIEALRGLDVEAKIVVGGSNPHLEQLRSQISGFGFQASLIADTQEMPSLMAWADVAIAAGGTTSWELAFMGLPSLVIVLANNQKDIASALACHSVSINLGMHTNVAVQTIADALESLLSDAPLREAMNLSGRALVDGNGVERVVKLFTGGDHEETDVLKSRVKVES